MSDISPNNYLRRRLRHVLRHTAAADAQLQHAAAPVAHLHSIASRHVELGAPQHSVGALECPACAAGREDHPLPTEVTKMMAMREHRMHHWLFHNVRNSWNIYPRDLQHRIDELGWKPPRPALDEKGVPIPKNDSGEDFLYMHRQMIADVNAVLADVGEPNYPRVQGWHAPPPPGDQSYPVPPAWFDPGSQDDPGDARLFPTLQRFKSDAFYETRFRFWQRTFRDPTFLRSVTLGELGCLIENTIHSAMHIRWSAPMGSTRPEPTTPDPTTPTDEFIDPTKGEAIRVEWDDPRYDFLLDFYSSHVNPIFWKLHGWIDDRVEDWKIANGVFGSDFWKGKWVGKMPGHEQGPAVQALPAGSEKMPGQVEGPAHDALRAGSEQAVSHIADMQEIANRITRAGVFHRPFVQRL